MSATRPAQAARRTAILVGGGLAVLLAAAVAGTLLAVLLIASASSSSPACGAGPTGEAGTITLGPPGSGRKVGATEYGGPGDPSSGTVGASGANLLAHPDSYAELGGTTFQTATAMGGLAYTTPLRVTWSGHSAVAYKRDFGLGGGPVDGLPRVIDLWWQFAGALGIPYDGGMWSGPVGVGRPPAAGSGNVLGQSVVPASDTLVGQASPSCADGLAGGVPLTPGPRARLLSDGQAEAPSGAPPAVQGMIAAGNQIAGKPYLYGGAHGLPLNRVASAYDCSSSVEHLLYGGRLLPVDYAAASGTLESLGQPGAGRWVTVYANADHVFMYVAGLRWDTWNAAGPEDGTSGIGWHPLVRSSMGFVARHPVGL